MLLQQRQASFHKKRHALALSAFLRDCLRDLPMPVCRMAYEEKRAYLLDLL